MKDGFINDFNLKSNVDFLKKEVENTISYLVRNNITLIREKTEISKKGNVGFFTFEVYLNGAQTVEQDSLDFFINQNHYPCKNSLYIGKNGSVYILWGHIPNRRNPFILINVNDINEQVLVNDNFVKTFFTEKTSIKIAQE